MCCVLIIHASNEYPQINGCFFMQKQAKSFFDYHGKSLVLVGFGPVKTACVSQYTHVHLPSSSFSGVKHPVSLGLKHLVSRGYETFFMLNSPEY